MIALQVDFYKQTSYDCGECRMIIFLPWLCATSELELYKILVRDNDSHGDVLIVVGDA